MNAYNILDADNANLAQDSISDMQELESYGAGTVTLTQAQWTGFSLIGGTADLVLAGGGLFDLDSPEVQAGAQFASLTAQGWTGTTLVGNGTNGQTLTASLYGNDTLTAGDGTGDVLVAGEGVDTLTGGTGGDTFVCPDGLAAGSTVTGNGGGNTLQLNGDISGNGGITVGGIQILGTGDITLTASQFNALTAISYDGPLFQNQQITPGTINCTTAGTYDLATQDATTDAFNMTALSAGGTTLIGNGGAFETLTAANDNVTNAMLLKQVG